jgi:DNA invertase Pin-like site-specific DNA recombinase
VSGRKRASVDSLRGLPAGLLGRVSGVIQESDGYSLGQQLRRCRETAEELGVVVVGEDFEQGSGQDWDLAGLNRWLRASRHGTVKVLILKNVSRLSRSRAKQAWIEHNAAQAGLILHYYDEEYADNAAGRFSRGVMGEVAEFMLEQAREDSMAARYEKVEQHGRPVGNGPLPYGWQRVIDRSGAKPRTVSYEHHPEHAAVIKRFRLLRTISTRELADRLNAEGVPPPAMFRPSEKRPFAGRWEPTTIRHILDNRMIWGEYRYGERERYKVNGKWRQRPKADATVKTLWFDPILERAEVEEIRAVVSGRHRRYTTGWTGDGCQDDAFILRGMLVCGCGSTLRTQTVTGRSRTGGPARYYRCPRTNRRMAERQGCTPCTLPPLVADRQRRGADGAGIEDVVWEHVTAFFGDEQAMAGAIRQAREQDDSAREHVERLAFIRATLAAARESFQRATDRWSQAADDLDRDSFEATRQKLKRDIASYEVEQGRLERAMPRGVSDDDEGALLAFGRAIRTVLAADLTPSERRAICERVRLRVEVQEDAAGAYAIGRHRYALDGTALGSALRSSSNDNLTWLSLRLLRSDGLSAVVSLAS